MTEEQIIKALECCLGNTKCGECPILGTPNCMNKVFGYALDLINRHKAENEMLKDLITYQKQEIKEKEQKYNQVVDDMFGLIETTRNEIAEAKSEALKEIVAKVKDATFHYYDSDIDNILKEMESDKNV